MIQTQARPRAVDGDPAGALDAATLAALSASCERRPSMRLAQNAVARTSVDDLLLNQQIVTSTDHTFSVLCWTTGA